MNPFPDIALCRPLSWRWRDAARAWISISLAAASLAAPAQTAKPGNNQAIELAEQDEHRRIVLERAAAEQRYTAQELVCRQRFVVSSCLDDAKRLRRAALQPLRERQIEIDTARRKRASAERSESIAKKAADEGAKAGVSMSSRTERRGAAPAASGAEAGLAAKTAGVASGVPAASAPVRKRPVPSQPIKMRPLEPRIADEAGNRAAFKARQETAARHRREVDVRNAEQAAKRKPAKPLAPASAAGVPPRSASDAEAFGSKPAR